MANETNEIYQRRKALKLSQKKLAEMVQKAVPKKDGDKDQFSYQALQKIESGGESRFMTYLLRVLENEERRRLIGSDQAERLGGQRLIELAHRHESFLVMFDALNTRRRKWVIDEIAEQLEKQREGPEKIEADSQGAVVSRKQ